MDESETGTMKRLCVGISELTPGWQSLLDQIGNWYEEVNFSLPLTNQYSMIILSKPLPHQQQKKLAAYLHHGGCLLIQKRIRSFNATEKSPTGFSVKLPASYQEKASLYIHGDGYLITTDFNPDDDFANNKYVRKRFFFKQDMHPDELVSSVNKGILAKTVDLCLKDLHLKRNLPYIKKWHSPTKTPVFGFRVDSDFGTKESIQSLYHIAREHDVPMTWFLHVQAHEKWLDYFNSFEGQEIALHGYEHGTSSSFEQVRQNISQGYSLLEAANLKPDGFCVPYGIWNEALAKALNQFQFEYSSEFTVGYDANPFFPIQDGEIHHTLQIPIHPICTGSLNRKHATESEMLTYFLGVLEQKLSSFDNVFFYHHPLQPGTQIWNTVFEKVNELELSKITFLEFARFWKTRKQSTIEAHYDSTKREIQCDSSNPDQFISVSMESDSFFLIPAKKTNQPLLFEDKIHLEDIDKPDHSELIELSSNPLQLYKTSLLDWRNRKRL